MTEFASVDAKPFFPTYIWVLDLKPETYEPLNRQVAKDLNDLTAPRPQILPGQNWQTEQNLHEFEEFADLVRIFYDATATVLEALELEHGPPMITGCWANINPKGSFHMPHTHPNNFLSGVYYAESPAGGDAIRFHDPRPQTSIVKPPVAQMTAVNTDHVFLKVRPGTLIVFPAWLHHSVPRNESSERRVNVAFNMMFSDFAEGMARPMWKGVATEG